MSEEPRRYRTALVGCGGMGRSQARILRALARFELVGLCDPVPGHAEAAAAESAAARYSDAAPMFADLTPEVVVVTTPNDSHAPLTLAAIAAGARAVFCEKPMATNMADARRMVRAAAQARCALVVNHQRRLGDDLRAMRDVIESGRLGEVYLIRSNSAGDVLSDGTHAVDSLRFLTGDRDVRWVLGQVHRVPPEPDSPDASQRVKGSAAANGTRYGHVVETGAMAVGQFDGGPRFEMFFGDLTEGHSGYQEYEVVGTRGRLLRSGDRPTPNVFISDGVSPDLKLELRPYPRRPHAAPLPPKPDVPAPQPDQHPATWRALALADPPPGDAPWPDLIARAFMRLADAMDRDTPDQHPMSAAGAVKTTELVMAIYESARLRRKLTLPLEQDRYPLELMLESSPS